MKFIQTCVLFFIIYTILLEMVPGESFRKYMKFIGGFLFLLLFIQGLFGMEDTLPVMLRNYYQRLEVDSTDQKDKKMILEEYEEQTERQMKSLLEKEGFDVKTVRVHLKGQSVDRVSIEIEHADQMDMIEIKNKISQVYSVESSHINVKV